MAPVHEGPRARTHFRPRSGNVAEPMAGKSPRRPSAAISRIAHRDRGITARYEPPFNSPPLLIFPTFRALSPLVSSAASGHARIPAFFLAAFTSVRSAASRLYGVSFVPQLAPGRRLVFGRVGSFKRIADKSPARRLVTSKPHAIDFAPLTDSSAVPPNYRDNSPAGPGDRETARSTARRLLIGD